MILNPVSHFLFFICIPSSVQLSSVTQLCRTLCDHMIRSTPGLPVHHQLPGVHWNSRPSSQWCHPAISSCVIPFSSCPQSLPASESFPMSQLFAWGGQSTRVILIQTVQDLHDINTAWILQDVGVFLFCFVFEKARVSTVESVMSFLRAKILAHVFRWPLCLSHNTCPLLPSSSVHRPKNSTFLSVLPAINI